MTREPTSSPARRRHAGFPDPSGGVAGSGRGKVRRGGSPRGRSGWKGGPDGTTYVTFAGFAHGSMRICDSLPIDVEGCICGGRGLNRARLVLTESPGAGGRAHGQLGPSGRGGARDRGVVAGARTVFRHGGVFGVCRVRGVVMARERAGSATATSSEITDLPLEGWRTQALGAGGGRWRGSCSELSALVSDAHSAYPSVASFTLGGLPCGTVLICSCSYAGANCKQL